VTFDFDFFGPVVRRIPQKGNWLYLTFDDGPQTSTPEVLEVLEQLKISATFFLIGNSAKNNRSLIKEMKKLGHAFGNHSIDHAYQPFFQSRDKILQWLSQSEELLASELGHESVGFRPPAGVQTPPLHWAANNLQLPLILWSRRFFDTVVKWTPSRALNSLDKTQSGDIILLHDGQSQKRLPEFLLTLKIYIEEARKRGFEFETLNRKVCVEALKIDN
jgi:peptidoglycan/xylan/chitin deacetylase (PgdA/CDA1 family)